MFCGTRFKVRSVSTLAFSAKDLMCLRKYEKNPNKPRSCFFDLWDSYMFSGGYLVKVITPRLRTDDFSAKPDCVLVKTTFL